MHLFSMDFQSSSCDHATPLSFKSISFYKTEDSGYHTSFATTPSLQECSSSTPSQLKDSSLLLSNICQLKVGCFALSPESEVRSITRHYDCFNPTNTHSSAESTPLSRRGVKRRHDNSQNEIPPGTVATPTSLIAKEVQKLKVDDAKVCKEASLDTSHIASFSTDICLKDYVCPSITHPSTPIKKICRSSCNLSPFGRQKSPRRVDFAIHSLSCEKQILKVQPKPQTKDLFCNRFGYKPNQKLDIIKMLYDHEKYWSSSIRKILGYLSKEDLFNFTFVSEVWRDIFRDVNTRQSYKDYMKNVKSNLENKDKVDTPKTATDKQRPLKEIQNINMISINPHSPTRSPRTTRFNKFTKSASLDSRCQVLCIKCRHPAKVTVELSGEQWGECTSSTCAQQFCRQCKFDRHPGKKCFQYDLEGPSPSKRKKNVCPVSSVKSRKNLKRLLCY